MNSHIETNTSLTSLAPPLPSSPQSDLAQLWAFGVAGVAIPQYLRWADDLGLFVLLSDKRLTTEADILANTTLSARGIDAIFGVLCSLGLVRRVGNGYEVQTLAREYLDKRSPFYIGGALYGMHKRPLPPGLQRGEEPRRFSKITNTFWYWTRFVRKKFFFWGKPERLLVQHSRNFPAAVAATESSFFAGIEHLVDIGGGSGVFVIPLAMRYPRMKLTLMELPKVLPNIDMFLQPYALSQRVRLVGHDMHQTPWPLQDCDGILFANMLHFCDDEECLLLLKESCRVLPVGGKIFLHEMLWNDSRDAPLVTALWNFWLISVSAGRQRTANEFADLFRRSGFSEPTVEETLGGFSLVVASKIRAC